MDLNSQTGYGIRTATWTVLLIATTVGGMVLAAETALAAVNEYLFTIPIVGVIVYGVLLTAGHWYTERYLEAGASGKAVASATLLSGTYAVFGAGILSHLGHTDRYVAIGQALAATTVMVAVITLYVYRRPDKPFTRWRDAAKKLFIGGIGVALIGSFFRPILLLAYLAFTVGFILMYGWETAHVRDEHHDRPVTAAVGAYVAFVGIFVHALQGTPQ